MGVAVWRHPNPRDVAGRCIGRTDVLVDRRKAKRLAHRVRQWARRHGAARVVFTSSLQRGASVGRCLSRWGWQHRIDDRLNELDFGAWDGQAWAAIGASAVDAWCADFAHHAPGSGEAVAALLVRCRSFLDEHADARSCCVVGHAGWISAAQWLAAGRGAPTAGEWPASVGYGVRVEARVAACCALPG